MNEHYLFHGTKRNALNHICNQGLNVGMASANALLGRAIYTAESSTKADQYTGKTAKLQIEMSSRLSIKDMQTNASSATVLREHLIGPNLRYDRQRADDTMTRMLFSEFMHANCRHFFSMSLS